MQVRNLCYMVTRREKIAKSFLKMKEDIFEQQVKVMSQAGLKLSEREKEAVVLASQSEHIYDRLGSNDPMGPKPCVRFLVDALEGREVVDLYGQLKKVLTTPTRLPNPYAKQYVNGLRSRRLSVMSTAGDTMGEGSADEKSTVPDQSDDVALFSRPLPKVASSSTRRNGEVNLQEHADEVGEVNRNNVTESPKAALTSEPMIKVEQRSESRSTCRRFRNRTLNTSEKKDKKQSPDVIQRDSEEAADMTRYTRSAAHRLEDVSKEQQDAIGERVSNNADSNKSATDENMPKRPERRETRGVLCGVPVPESLSQPPRSTLSGYRIPKKVKTPNGILEDRRGSSPVSPLHEVPSHCYVGSDGYSRGQRRGGGEASWDLTSRRSVLTPHWDGYTERWKRDLGDFSASGSKSAVAEWSSKSEVKENGSRYSMRYRPKYGKDS